MDKKAFDTLKNNLPEKPDLIGREKFFNSAVLAPLVFIDGEYHFLFQRRAKSIRQGDEICFPGGKYEPDVDANFQDTAIRETCEELGIDKDKISVIGQLGKMVLPIGVAVEVFIGDIEQSTLEMIKIDENEVAEIFTLPVTFFKNTPAERYNARVEMQPTYIDENRKEHVLLPSQALDLPKRYHLPWGENSHRVLVYKTEHGPLWGLTAEIVHELVEKFIS